jgi:osmotically-inducible protein OsmY
MTDKALKQAVLNKLGWEPSIDAAHIGVTALDGVITLSGHVSTFPEKWAAERAASRVSGVKALAEALAVRFFNQAKTSDEEIGKRALQQMVWDVSVPGDKLKVKVEKGFVTLTGNVDWYYQKHNAEANVRRLEGVTGVVNDIVIKPPVVASDVRNKIVAAFGRNAEIDAEDIVVSANGGKVTLKGDVDSYSEFWLAQSTAWSAPGVTDVENLLTVN